MLSLGDGVSPQVCCAGYCDECSDYPSCGSQRGQNSTYACCKTQVYERRCGEAPANVCLQSCTESVPPCIMPSGEVFTTPAPGNRTAGDDCNNATSGTTTLGLLRRAASTTGKNITTATVPKRKASTCSGLKIAVIGGGLAGLSAAEYILENDPTATVKLFEGKDNYGGRTARMVFWNGDESLVLEKGAQWLLYAGQTTSMKQLWQEMEDTAADHDFKYAHSDVADWDTFQMARQGEVDQRDVYKKHDWMTNLDDEWWTWKMPNSNPLSNGANDGVCNWWVWKNGYAGDLKTYMDASRPFMAPGENLEQPDDVEPNDLSWRWWTRLYEVEYSGRAGSMWKGSLYEGEYEKGSTRIFPHTHSKVVDYLVWKLNNKYGGRAQLKKKHIVTLVKKKGNAGTQMKIKGEQTNWQGEYMNDFYGTFDRVILAVPLSILQAPGKNSNSIGERAGNEEQSHLHRIEVQGLPQSVKDLLAKFGMGTLRKSYAIFRKKFWADATVVPSAAIRKAPLVTSVGKDDGVTAWEFHEWFPWEDGKTKNGDVSETLFALTGFTLAGDEVWQKTKDERKQLAFDHLQALYGADAVQWGDFVDLVEKSWDEDAFTGGSYSFMGVNGRKEDRDALRDVGPLLNGKLFIAGEFASANPGTTIGARDSGIAAGENVLASC